MYISVFFFSFFYYQAVLSFWGSTRRYWRRRVSGTSFLCLVCATWTQVSGDQKLGRRTWVVCHPPKTSKLHRSVCTCVCVSVEDSCKWCCRNVSASGDERTCKPYELAVNSSLPDRTPCVHGYCLQVVSHCCLQALNDDCRRRAVMLIIT